MKKKLFKQYFLITLGVLSVAFSYYYFFLPLSFVNGGVTGISTIIKSLVNNPHFKVSYVIFGLNVVLLFVGLFALGKDFFIKTIYGSLLLPVFTYIFESLTSPTFFFEIDQRFFGASEMNYIVKALIAVILGGIISGFGLGICYKNNGSTGGGDVVQKILIKYLHMPYSLSMYLTDGAVIVISFFVFGLEKTLFSLMMIIIVGKMADYVEIGGKVRRTAFIISKKHEEIKRFIIDEMDRGVTVSLVEGGYSKEHFPMLICTLDKTESFQLRDYIFRVDPAAFTFYVSAREVYGDGFEETN